jgi:hypothetical protein
LATSVIFKKLPKVNNRPRIFAQSAKFANPNSTKTNNPHIGLPTKYLLSQQSLGYISFGLNV